MEDSIAHQPFRAGALDLPAWKTFLSVTAAVLLALLFVLAGVWKITDPYGAATRLTQMKVPGELAIPGTIALGITETFAALLLFVPRFRRWGAWLTGLLLVVFMAYIGVNYAALTGQDCSCFPDIKFGGVEISFKRAVGPEFFIGDGVMLLMALIAGWWARRSEGLRTSAIILGAITVFALVSYGAIYAKQTGLKAPDNITVDGQTTSLQHGRIFLYFFDPECSHCYQAAQKMAKYNWHDTRVIGIPTAMPQFAKQFLTDTGLKAGISNDLELLKKTFTFTAGPYGVALEHGRQKEQFINFDDKEPEAGLKQLGFLHR